MKRHLNILLAMIIIVSSVLIMTLSLGFRMGDCVKFGYPDSRFSGGRIYCVRIVNQTHEVILLSELEK